MTQAAAPLVMLHGWALNLRVFDDLIVRLQTPSGTAPHGGARSLLRLDLPGHGRASEPPALYGGDPEGAWDLGAVADHLLAQLPPRYLLALAKHSTPFWQRQIAWAASPSPLP